MIEYHMLLSREKVVISSTSKKLKKAPEKLRYHIVNRESNSPSNPVKSSLDLSNKRSKAILIKKLCINFSVSSLNIRLKKSHRERVICRHIGRILPDFRDIRNRKFKRIS